jgi:type II secretory pathway component PulK
MALVENLTANNVNILLAKREHFTSVHNFIIHDTLAGLKIYSENLSVSSSYFLFTAQVKIVQMQIRLNSVLYRNADEIQVIMRNKI